VLSSLPNIRVVGLDLTQGVSLYYVR
jgi:hypothetical protein